MLPPVRDDRVCYQFHSPELLLSISDGDGIPEEHGGSVVIVMAVRGKSQDQAIEFCGCHADGEALSFKYVLGGGRGRGISGGA